MSNYRYFYIDVVRRYHHNDFPNLLNYTRFLEVMSSISVPLSAYFTFLKGRPTGIEFIDSTSIKVCHNLRIPRHKAFADFAKRGKSTMGWFYGFKLHIIVNDLGDIVTAKLTTRNVDDRKPVRE